MPSAERHSKARIERLYVREALAPQERRLNSVFLEPSIDTCPLVRPFAQLPVSRLVHDISFTTPSWTEPIKYWRLPYYRTSSHVRRQYVLPFTRTHTYEDKILGASWDGVHETCIAMLCSEERVCWGLPQMGAYDDTNEKPNECVQCQTSPLSPASPIR